jgi:Tyrosine-protein kinase ephrin type A/B receptor-like
VRVTKGTYSYGSRAATCCPQGLYAAPGSTSCRPLTCPHFSFTSPTNNATANYTSCPFVLPPVSFNATPTVTISTGCSCIGNPVLRLFDSTDKELMVSTTGCGSCSSLVFTPTADMDRASLYSVRVGCSGTSMCSGDVMISGSFGWSFMPSPAPTPSPTMAPTCSYGTSRTAASGGCQPCPPGSYDPGVGDDSCQLCPLGMYHREGSLYA